MCVSARVCVCVRMCLCVCARERSASSAKDCPSQNRGNIDPSKTFFFFFLLKGSFLEEDCPLVFASLCANLYFELRFSSVYVPVLYRTFSCPVSFSPQLSYLFKDTGL